MSIHDEWSSIPVNGHPALALYKKTVLLRRKSDEYAIRHFNRTERVFLITYNGDFNPSFVFPSGVLLPPLLRGKILAYHFIFTFRFARQANIGKSSESSSNIAGACGEIST